MLKNNTFKFGLRLEYFARIDPELLSNRFRSIRRRRGSNGKAPG